MNDFTASNGFQIVKHLDGFHIIDDEGRDSLSDYSHMSEMDMDALREFFQAEADERLGRWRWPENPDYVVYPCSVKTRVRVLRERGTGELEWVDQGDGRSYEFVHAARAYFDAHPEPKPWRDAAPGEVWALTLDGAEGVFLHAGGAWYGQGGMRVVIGHPIRDANVTAGRRIWPEVSA